MNWNIKEILNKIFNKKNEQDIEHSVEVDNIKQEIDIEAEKEVSESETKKEEPEDSLLLLQKALLPNGISPSNFSISLGAAPCTHTCLFCPQSIEKPKEQKWLDLKILEKVLSEMPEENFLLNVSSYSETMLAPNLFQALELMKKIRPKLPIVLATNGTSITEEQVNKLIDLELDILQFSFDAPDKETYKILMQCDHFDRAVEKLEMICRVRKERNSSMKIYTHIMGFESLKEKFEEFRERWQDKVDAINFRSVSNWGDDGLSLKSKLADLGFVPVYKKPEKRFPCTSVFMHFKIAPDGNYYPCVAYIPEKEEKDKEHSLGNALHTTFQEAWEKLDWQRQKHLKGEWDECRYCSSCDVWGLWQNMYYEKDGNFYLNEKIANGGTWN